MILLLGASGYVGSTFAKYFVHNAIPFLGVSRRFVDYTQRDDLIKLIRDSDASFLINAAGFTGKPNVDACEIRKAECLAGNAVLPATIREACEFCDLSWGHVSSGCIYHGTRADGSGFTEADSPNFSFRSGHCSFYSGTKALGEECLAGSEHAYIWRIRMPFNSHPSRRNYLTKLQTYERLLDVTNSLTQLDEFVQAAHACWQRRVPIGTYNVTNTGAIATHDIAALLKKHLLPDRDFDYFDNEAEFMQQAAIAPRSNCVLDNAKLRDTGINIRAVHDAVESSLMHWHEQLVLS